MSTEDDASIKIRLNPDERAAIEAAAASRDLTISAFVRTAALNLVAALKRAEGKPPSADLPEHGRPQRAPTPPPRGAEGWSGCELHPDADGILGPGGRVLCGAPGCTNMARFG
jgi:hypothetical protein